VRQFLQLEVLSLQLEVLSRLKCGLNGTDYRVPSIPILSVIVVLPLAVVLSGTFDASSLRQNSSNNNNYGIRAVIIHVIHRTEQTSTRNTPQSAATTPTPTMATTTTTAGTPVAARGKNQ
jgi:hypothetical protein